MRGFGIDFAMPAMFLCQLVYQLKNRLDIVVAILSGLLAVALAWLIPGNAYIVLASAAAAAVGVLIRRGAVPDTAEGGTR